MIEPVDHIRQFRKDAARRHRGPVDQNDQKAQIAGGGQLCCGTGTTGILGHDQINVMRAHQGPVADHIKGTAGHMDLSLRQRQRPVGRVDKAQQVMMLGPRCKNVEVLFADGQKHPCGAVRQFRHGGFGVRYRTPVIARPGAPRCPFERGQPHLRFSAGDHRIAAHLGGEWMGCIDHMGDPVITQISRQTRWSAKPAHAHGQGLGHGGRCPTRVREHRISATISQAPCKGRGFAGATQDEDAGHV